MAPKKKELEARIDELTERHDALAETVRRLAMHSAVLAVALRDPQAVPKPDLEAALTGIEELSQAR